jgi:2-oxoisovalerate dehydrogenase E1 component
MVKQLFVDPRIVRKKDSIDLGSIQINSFDRSLADSIRDIDPNVAIQVFRDLFLIRNFELMLEGIKKFGKYQDVAFKYAGPAHLSIGQEAAAVGQALALEKSDVILGSHRSHGEVLAKGLRMIDLLSSDEIESLMGSGECQHIMTGFQGRSKDRVSSAVEFFVFGLLSEIFGKRTGFNRGLGGSMHSFFLPLGIFPNNAIVGGSAPIATGVALFNRVNEKHGIVVANIGDASSACGPVWESMNFAAMQQFKSLFDDSHKGGLPIIYFFMNNFYGMGGQPIGETMGFERLARIGSGINPEKMHAEVVDGTNVFAVFDAVARARKTLMLGQGPVLIDCQTYRFSGHSPSDASSYRNKEEIDAWRESDAVSNYREALLSSSLITEVGLTQLEQNVSEILFHSFKLAINNETSPRLQLERFPDQIGEYTFNNTSKSLVQGLSKDLLTDPSQVFRIQSLSKKSRSGLSDSGILSGMKAITYRDAIFEAVLSHAQSDSTLTIFGEENRDWGGAFGVYQGLTELLPRHRLFNTPIAEAAIVGAGVGYAMSGGRALVELMYADFIGRAGDEIFNQMAKWQAMSGGMVSIPMVLRISVGSKYGAQHSQDWSSMVAQIPGLKIIYPATAYDAKGLMASALESNDPVIFFENQRLYDDVETLHSGGVPIDYYKLPIGIPSVVQSGSDLTIFTLGAPLSRAISAAKTLRDELGVSTEIIDARSMVPFDPDILLQSVAKTRRLICVSDGCERGNWMHGIINIAYEKFGNTLLDPITFLAAPNWITPAAEQEWTYFPSANNIFEAAKDMGFLVSIPTSDSTDRLTLKINRMKRGI